MNKSFFIGLYRYLVSFQRYSSAYIYLIVLGLVMFGVITRNFFNFSLSWVEELARYLTIWIAAMGAAIATKDGEHVYVEAIFRFIPSKLHSYFKGFLGVVSVVFLVIFTYYTFRHAAYVATTGQLSPSMNWFHMFWVYVILGICFLMMIIEYCLWTLRMFLHSSTGSDAPERV